MPIFVNSERVREEMIQEETVRIGQDLRWASIADPVERNARLREAAEHSAINRVLLEQAAAKDPRPIDPSLLAAEVERQKTAGGCRSAFDDRPLRQHTEKYLRLGRLTQEFTSRAAKPSESEIAEFYKSNRTHFSTPERFHASHIVIHVNEGRTEEQAESAIQAALQDLEHGQDFGTVADRHSDCKGNGGDLGVFPAGHMVEEFERALRQIRPGERTGVFTTPFGFHIAYLRAFEPAGAAEFEDVKGDVERVLAAMAEHREFLKAIDELRRRATIMFTPEESLVSQ